MLTHVTLATISPALLGAIVVILLGGAWVVYAYRKPRNGQAARTQPDRTTPSPTTRPVAEQRSAASLNVQRRLGDFTPNSEPQQAERWIRDRQTPPAATIPAEDSGIVVLHPSNPALAEAARRNGTTGAAEPPIVRTEPIPIRPAATPPDAAQPAGLSATGDDDYDYVDHSELSTGPLGALPPAPKRD